MPHPYKYKLYLLLGVITQMLALMPIVAQIPVTGSVQNKEKSGLPSANVMFFCADSLVAGGATNQEGYFALKLDSGTYIMSIHYIGYEEYVDTFRLTTVGKQWKIILEEKAYALGETVISAERIGYESDLNKDVFNIPIRIKKSATDPYDVLQHVPMLSVDVINRTVVMLGAERSIVMVNNVRRDFAYLQTLRPEEIDKVEVIRNPGARYTSKNIDGVINIITKGEKNGHRASLYNQINPFLIFHSAGGSYSFLSSKTRVSLSGSYFNFNEPGKQSSMYRQIQKGDDMLLTEKAGDGHTEKTFYTSLNVNYEYSLSDKSLLILSFQPRYNPNKSTEEFEGTSLTNGKQEYSFQTINNNSGKSLVGNGSVYYQTWFNSKEQLLSIETNYLTDNYRSSRLYTETRPGYEYRNDQDRHERQNSIDLQADYSHPLPWTKLETGYRFYHQTNKYEQKTNGVPDTMKYMEWRNFVYFQGMGIIGKKISYQLGFGVDAVQTNVNTFRNHFYELIPNAMVRYHFNSVHNARLDYSRSRSSPSFNLLNPIERYGDSLQITQGNPNLLPYYIHKLSAGYTFFKNKIYISPYIRYSFTNNYITNIEKLDDQGVYRTSYANTSHYSSLFFSLDASFNITQWWKLSLNGDLMKRTYEDIVNQVNKSFWEKDFYFSSMIDYKKFSWSLRYRLSLRQPTLTGYAKGYSESSTFASWQCLPALRIQAGLRYLVPSKSKYETYNTGYTEIWEHNNANRYLMLLVGFSYQFQTGKTNQTRQSKRDMKKFDSTVNM